MQVIQFRQFQSRITSLLSIHGASQRHCNRSQETRTHKILCLEDKIFILGPPKTCFHVNQVRNACVQTPLANTSKFEVQISILFGCALHASISFAWSTLEVLDACGKLGRVSWRCHWDGYGDLGEWLGTVLVLVSHLVRTKYCDQVEDVAKYQWAVWREFGHYPLDWIKPLSLAW